MSRTDLFLYFAPELKGLLYRISEVKIISVIFQREKQPSHLQNNQNRPVKNVKNKWFTLIESIVKSISGIQLLRCAVLKSSKTFSFNIRHKNSYLTLGMLKLDFIMGFSSGQKKEALLAHDASWPVLGCNKRLAVCMCVFYSPIKEQRLTTSNLVVSLKDVY